jgi:polar amino acid transport system substrate-binding protein
MPILRPVARVMVLAAPLMWLQAAAQTTAPTSGLPAQFRFCSIDIPFPPYARTDGTGYLQHLIIQAAANIHLKFERYIAPRRRCIEEVRNGTSDGMIATYLPERVESGAFPMRDAVVDESKALGTVSFVVYRRSGTRVDWDGQRFSDLRDGMVGVESGFVGVIDKLTRLGVRVDEGAKSLEQNLIKLVAGRVDAVVAMDLEADKLMMKRFAGKIEPVARPFDATVLYLMVSKSFQARYPQFMESYWQAIKDYRDSPDYRAYQSRNP